MTKLSKKIILFFFYSSLCASLICTALPSGKIAVFALMTSICILSFIYSLRVRAQRSRNRYVIIHTLFMISTFWRALGLFITSCFAALLYMLVAVEYAPIEQCASAVYDTIYHGQLHVLSEIFELCGALIIEKNKVHFYVVRFIVFSPFLLYVLLRCVRGVVLLMRVRKNNRVRENA